MQTKTPTPTSIDVKAAPTAQDWVELGKAVQTFSPIIEIFNKQPINDGPGIVIMSPSNKNNIEFSKTVTIDKSITQQNINNNINNNDIISIDDSLQDRGSFSFGDIKRLTMVNANRPGTTKSEYNNAFQFDNVVNALHEIKTFFDKIDTNTIERSIQQQIPSNNPNNIARNELKLQKSNSEVAQHKKSFVDIPIKDHVKSKSYDQTNHNRNNTS